MHLALERRDLRVFKLAAAPRRRDTDLEELLGIVEHPEQKADVWRQEGVEELGRLVWKVQKELVAGYYSLLFRQGQARCR